MIEENRFRIGVFVFLGMFLFFGALVMLGVAEQFRAKILLTTVFEESVQGLEVGAPVKFKGVTVGVVSDIVIDSDNKVVRVDMEAEYDGAELGRKNEQYLIDLEMIHTELQKLVNEGLHCQMELSGITGVKHIELDYEKGYKPKSLAHGDLGQSFFIPSKPSFITGAMENIGDAVTKISEIDFKGISEELRELVLAMQQVFDSKRLDQVFVGINEAIVELKNTAVTIQKAMPESELALMRGNLNRLILSLEKTSNEIAKEMKKADLGGSMAVAKTTLTDISSAMGTAETAMKEFTGSTTTAMTEFNKTAASFKTVPVTMEQTMVKLQRTLENLDNLIQTLQQDPSSVVYGK